MPPHQIVERLAAAGELGLGSRRPEPKGPWAILNALDGEVHVASISATKSKSSLGIAIMADEPSTLAQTALAWSPWRPLPHPSVSPLPSIAAKPGFVPAPWRPRTATFAEALREILAWLRGARPSLGQRIADERRVERLADLWRDGDDDEG